MNRASCLLLVSALTGCSTTVPVAPEPVGPGTPVKGWHTAGLVLSEADKDAGGVHWLAAISSELYAATASGKLFKSVRNRASWERVELPGADSAYTMLAIDSTLYVGTRNSGQVFAYDVAGSKWKNLEIGIGRQVISSLANWEGALAVFTFARSIKDSTQYVKIWKDGVWTDFGKGWPYPGGCPASLGPQPDQIYGATYSQGLWRRAVGDTAWRRLPDPFFYDRYPDGKDYLQVLGKPRALAWYQGNLWVGYLIWSQIHRLSGTDTPWVATKVDTVAFPGRALPQDVFALKVLNGRLFGGGQIPGTPMVYVDGSGWRFLRTNWGMSDDGRNVTCGTDITLDFAAVADTLYVAGCGGVYELPFDQVP